MENAFLSGENDWKIYFDFHRELEMQDVMPMDVKGRTKLGNKRDSFFMYTKEEKGSVVELWKLKRPVA